MLDGQNRLLAVQRANVAVPFWIARGAPRDSFFVIDTGQPRNLFHALAIEGQKNARQLAGGLNMLWRLPAGRDEDGDPANANPSTPVALAFFHEQDVAGLNASVNAASHIYYYLHGPHSAYTATSHLFLTLDSSDGEYFVDRLATGHELKKDNPVGVLRNTILALRAQPAMRSVDRLYIAALLIKAWNLYREGKPAKIGIHWKRGGANPEPFPVPV